MNIDITSYRLQTQQSQKLQKNTETSDTNATSSTSTVQKEKEEVDYAAAVTSIESGDRVEISEEGKKALAQMRVAQSSTQSEIEGSVHAEPAKPSGSKPSGPPPDVTASASTEDSGEEVSSTELYTLSETSLQSLLTEGSITRNEYAAELTRRGLDNAV